MSDITLTLTQDELATTISALLFSSSVNVVSDTTEQYQKQLIETAKKLKSFKPDVQLNDVQFIVEENYEDSWSEEILTEFRNNIKTATFLQA